MRCTTSGTEGSNTTVTGKGIDFNKIAASFMVPSSKTMTPISGFPSGFSNGVPYCSSAFNAGSCAAVSSSSTCTSNSGLIDTIRFTFTPLFPPGSEDVAASPATSRDGSTGAVSGTTSSIGSGKTISSCGIDVTCDELSVSLFAITLMSPSGTNAGAVAMIKSCSVAGACGANACGLGKTGSSTVPAISAGLSAASGASITPTIAVASGTSAELVSIIGWTTSTIGSTARGASATSICGASMVASTATCAAGTSRLASGETGTETCGAEGGVLPAGCSVTNDATVKDAPPTTKPINPPENNPRNTQ